MDVKVYLSACLENTLLLVYGFSKSERVYAEVDQAHANDLFIVRI